MKLNRKKLYLKDRLVQYQLTDKWLEHVFSLESSNLKGHSVSLSEMVSYTFTLFP